MNNFWQHDWEREAEPAARPSDDSPYLSPRDLAARWRCSRSTAQRIAEREGFTKLFLGSGTNGMVRYKREEVEAYETSRSVTSDNAT